MNGKLCHIHWILIILCPKWGACNLMFFPVHIGLNNFVHCIVKNEIRISWFNWFFFVLLLFKSELLIAEYILYDVVANVSFFTEKNLFQWHFSLLSKRPHFSLGYSQYLYTCCNIKFLLQDLGAKVVYVHVF